MTHGRAKTGAIVLMLLALLAWAGIAAAWIETPKGPGDGAEPHDPRGGDTDPDDFPIQAPNETTQEEAVDNEAHGLWKSILLSWMALSRI